MKQQEKKDDRNRNQNTDALNQKPGFGTITQNKFQNQSYAFDILKMQFGIVT